mgnify:CR=1 FL=1|jgi:hypothetical protein
MGLSAGVSGSYKKLYTHLTKRNSSTLTISSYMISNMKALVLVTLGIWIYETKDHPLNAIPTNFFALSDN